MVACESSPNPEVHVLLAEDNPVNQDVIFEMLCSLGCRVKVAVNGKEALEMAVNQRFDLILMDCQMPVMDGHDSTLEIRRNEKNKGFGHTPIIGITGKAVQGNYERCQIAGMDDHLDKPFTIRQLRNIICKWTGILLQDLDEQKILVPTSGAPSMPENSFPEVEACLDKSVLENICALENGSMTILQRIIDIYLRDTPVQLLTIREGIEENNPDKIFRASHSLKSSSANVGAFNLITMSQDLEMNARSKMIGDAGFQLTEIEVEFFKVASALKSIVENLNHRKEPVSCNPKAGYEDD